MSELSADAVNLQADALSAALAGGVVRLYEGSRLLVELPMEKPASGVAVGGILQWRVGSAFALARGVPDNYKQFTADGRLMDRGTVGRSDDDLIVSYDVIEKGGRITVGNMTHKVPR